MPTRNTLQKFAGCWGIRTFNSQTAEMGKVDAGGGGTIAYIMANYGMEVIDCGVAILCMHSPWEVPAKWTSMRPTAATERS